MSGVRPLILTWSALIGLLIVTVGASFVLTGPLSIIASLAVALTKSGAHLLVLHAFAGRERPHTPRRHRRGRLDRHIAVLISDGLRNAAWSRLSRPGRVVVAKPDEGAARLATGRFKVHHLLPSIAGGVTHMNSGARYPPARKQQPLKDCMDGSGRPCQLISSLAPILFTLRRAG